MQNLGDLTQKLQLKRSLVTLTRLEKSCGRDNTDQLYEIRFFAQENGVQFNCSNYFTFDYLAHGYWYIGMWLGSNPNWQELRSLRNSTSTICYGYDDNLIKFPVI